MNSLVFAYLRYTKIQNANTYTVIFFITWGGIHIRDTRAFKFYNWKIMHNRESFGKWRHNIQVLGGF